MILTCEARSETCLVSRLCFVELLFDSGVDDLGEDFVDRRDNADGSVVSGIEFVAFLE